MTDHQRLGRARTPRKHRVQRLYWMAAASEFTFGGDKDGFSTRPYLAAHPERETATEQDGTARCPACGVAYAPRLMERVISPAMLRAQRWAHSHNAAHHPRRWLREQSFPADIPTSIRERATCTCAEDVVCGACMTGALQ